jgi:hypothetical protein
MKKNLQDLTLADVKSAYVGKANRCCCGCSGDHYEPGVDDALMMNVLRTVQAHEGSLNDDGEGLYSAKVGRLLYIVYLVPGARELLEASAS